MLFVHGKLDKTVPYRNGLAALQGVPWPKAMMSVTKGSHVTITEDFEPVLDTTTDFWRWSLYGDAAAKARLKADATQGGTATLTADFSWAFAPAHRGLGGSRRGKRSCPGRTPAEV